MSDQLKMETAPGLRYALCVGVGQYTELTNCNLRYAVADAKAIAARLKDTQWGNFEVTLLTEPVQTTQHALVEALDRMLNSPSHHPEDLIVIYLSCHGNVYGKGNTFYILPSDARLEEDGSPKKTTVIDIHDIAKTLSNARVKNIIFLLDACYSGGAGGILQHLNLDLDLSPDTNLFIIGAARHDQVAIEASSLQHGIFTSCLLEAFEQKPKRGDGWLTISEIHSFLSEKIKSFETTHAEQIQGVSASVNPNLLFTKNPHHSVESREFYEQVKKLLQLIQYEPVEVDIPEEVPAGFYVAEVKAGLSIFRIGIIPYYNQVETFTIEAAEKLAHFVEKQIRNGNLDRGMIVTMLDVSEEVKATFQAIIGRSLEVRTYRSVEKNLLDFKKYLQKLVNDYEVASGGDGRASLARLYIPLNAERRQYEEFYRTLFPELEPATKGRITKVYRTSWKGDIEEEVKCWLSKPEGTRLALLADYGSGKTAFCQHIAAMLAKDYLRAREHGYHEQRIPLLIPLLDFAKIDVDLEGYLVAYLKRHCKVDNPDFEALVKMAEVGLLFFMLDGFDEMASRATNDTLVRNIALFERLANLPRNKVLLTTRPEYFMNLGQEQKVLRSYPRLYLQPFNEKQVNLYLQKRVPLIKPHTGEAIKDWSYYRQQIDKIHDLSDLVQRPVLLEMIIQTLPTLITEGEAVNRPNLYQHYLEGELERQLLMKERRDLQIDSPKRFEIMERIALELYQTDEVGLTSAQICDVARELLTLEQQRELESSLREILTCSFLNRIGDEYRFSHQSFLEYLVARHLAKDVVAEKRENFRQKAIGSTIRGFLLELEEGTLEKDSDGASILSTNVGFNYEKLESWFRDNPRDGWVSSNVISLLASLLPHDRLCKLPLQGADLSGADLSGADLSGVDLSGTDLSGADLSGTDLRHADLSGADLSGADLSGTDLSGADLSGTDLSGADLRYADLSEADLSGADLSSADLSGMDLSGMDLRDIDLSGADLSSADLSGMDLRDIDLSGADLSGADLSSADLRDMHLGSTSLRNADLRGADLRGADLRGANLQGMDLTGANLSSTNLSRANLRDADLAGTILYLADLCNADLRNANLSRANLRDAYLRNADISGANLLYADLSRAILDGIDLDAVELPITKESKSHQQEGLWGSQ